MLMDYREKAMNVQSVRQLNSKCLYLDDYDE